MESYAVYSQWKATRTLIFTYDALVRRTTRNCTRLPSLHLFVTNMSLVHSLKLSIALVKTVGEHNCAVFMRTMSCPLGEHVVDEGVCRYAIQMRQEEGRT